MKKIDMYQTLDGVNHADFFTAKKHAEKMYADELGALSREVLKLDSKYLATIGFIDHNLNRFVKLQQLKDDISLINNEEN